MSEYERETERPRQRILYDASAGPQELEEEIAHMQRKARCVQRAEGLMAIMTTLSAAGLGYPAILLENFPYSTPPLMMHVLYALGVGSLISLLAFASLGLVYRRRLDRREEAYRRMTTRTTSPNAG